MRGKRTCYTFVIEFLGGTYVHQATGESPELALRAWLRIASEDELSTYRLDLLEAIADERAVPVEGCQSVWCMSGVAGDHLFLIHIVGTESGSSGSRLVAEEQTEVVGVDPKRWGWGDRW